MLWPVDRYIFSIPLTIAWQRTTLYSDKLNTDLHQWLTELCNYILYFDQTVPPEVVQQSTRNMLRLCYRYETTDVQWTDGINGACAASCTNFDHFLQHYTDTEITPSMPVACSLHQSICAVYRTSLTVFYNNLDFITKFYWKKKALLYFYFFIIPLLGVIFNVF